MKMEKVVVIALVEWASKLVVSRNTWLGVRRSLLRDRSAPPAVGNLVLNPTTPTIRRINDPNTPQGF